MVAEAAPAAPAAQEAQHLLVELTLGNPGKVFRLHVIVLGPVVAAVRTMLTAHQM